MYIEHGADEGLLLLVKGDSGGGLDVGIFNVEV